MSKDRRFKKKTISTIKQKTDGPNVEGFNSC